MKLPRDKYQITERPADPPPLRPKAFKAPPELGPEVEEDTARLFHGLIEAGDLLFQHVQRIEWNPAASTMARECWLESRCKVSGDDTAKRYEGGTTVDEALARIRAKEKP